MRVPPTPFIGVSMGATLVLLVGWRAAFASSKEDPRTPQRVKDAIKNNKSTNKQGNILDMFKVIGGLTGRW